MSIEYLTAPVSNILCMEQTQWWRYVQSVLDERAPISQLEAARRCGLDGSAFSRWKKGGEPHITAVVKFARGMRLQVRDALVAAGIITAAEAAQREVYVGHKEALLSAPPEMLAEEILRRVRPDAS